MKTPTYTIETFEDGAFAVYRSVGKACQVATFEDEADAADYIRDRLRKDRDTDAAESEDAFDAERFDGLG